MTTLESTESTVALTSKDHGYFLHTPSIRKGRGSRNGLGRGQGQGQQIISNLALKEDSTIHADQSSTLDHGRGSRSGRGRGR